MQSILLSLVRTFLLLVLAAVSTGCISSKYKLAPSSTPPPVALNLAVPATPSAPPVKATVHTVIVYRGPGSWKQDAYWDEYIVSVANRGSTPVTIESATLIDFQDQPAAPGGSPWELEKQSRSYEARIARTIGDVLKVGGATVLTGAATGTAVVLGTWGLSASQASAAMALGGVAVMVAATVAVPVYSAVVNSRNKRDVESEFRHRRLMLPAMLVPGLAVQGSLFFRISPGPQRLALRCRVADGETKDVVIDLAPLAGLHLKAGIPMPAVSAVR